MAAMGIELHIFLPFLFMSVILPLGMDVTFCSFSLLLHA